MAITDKPTALQTDNEKATSAFESFLTPLEDTVEEVDINEVDVIDEDELTEEVDLEEDTESDDEFDYDDEFDDEEQNEIEDKVQQPTSYKVKIDGEEVEVTLDELQSGYSRQQDYTRKTQELAQQRKIIEQQQQELAQRDAIYAQLLPKLEAQLSADLANEPDWNRLYEDDPVGYVREKQLWDERKEKLKATQAENQRLQQEAYQKQQEQLAQFVQYGQQKLLEIVPEWKNPEIAQQEKLAIRDYGINTLGYTAQEMDTIYDYRALLGLRNAWLNDKTVQATKKKPTEKAPARVARPGAVTKIKSVAPAKRAKQRLAKTGKTSDAAKVFEQMLK